MSSGEKQVKRWTRVELSPPLGQAGVSPDQSVTPLMCIGHEPLSNSLNRKEAQQNLSSADRMSTTVVSWQRGDAWLLLSLLSKWVITGGSGSTGIILLGAATIRWVASRPPGGLRELTGLWVSVLWAASCWPPCGEAGDVGWQGRAAAKPLLRDFSTWPSLGGSPCSPAAEEGGEAEGAPSPGASRDGTRTGTWCSRCLLRPVLTRGSGYRWAVGGTSSAISLALTPLMSLWPRRLGK